MPFVVSREGFALFKSCLRTIWPLVKSSHADEVIAAYCGFKSYAALRSVLTADTATVSVDAQPGALFDRLEQLGYKMPEQQLDRILRLFQAEMLARMGENFRRMREETANDNTT